MGSFERITTRLPGLYAPEKRGDDLLSRLLGAVADRIDTSSEEITAIMQTHWFRYADSALYSPWFRLMHERGGEPLPKPEDTDVKNYPHIYDLGRLAALLGIMPWQEGSAYSESVEAYRKRIGRMVSLWRNGLGTLGALRTMVEASLPLHAESGVPLVDLPFSVEENPLVKPRLNQATIKGIPENLIGPLMRWRVTNNGQIAVAPTAYIQGIAAQEMASEGTIDPCIELIAGSGIQYRTALAWQGTIPPGVTMRIRPAFSSLCGCGEGAIISSSAPAGETCASPSPMTTWAPLDGAPVGEIVALCQTRDKTVWAAVNEDSDETTRQSSLWSFNGSSWKKVLDHLEFIHGIHESREGLLLATANGCMAIDPYAAPESNRVPRTFFGAGETVYCIAEVHGVRWFGTGSGAYIQAAGAGSSQNILPFAKVLEIASDSRGIVYIGSDCGLIQYHPASSDCWLYLGGDHSDGTPDWAAIDPLAAALPRPEGDIFLPGVTAVLRARDNFLWIGTTAGIARYGAIARETDVYTTNLAAFPLLGTGEVFDIQEDERGQVWFGTENGLIVFDGRDFYQVEGSALKRLIAQTDEQQTELAGEGIWRYNRAKEAWQQYSEVDDDWHGAVTERLVSDEGPVYASLWYDMLSADLGSFDGTAFSAVTTVPLSGFTVRFKVNSRRIITGGVPALPRMPAGTSAWRYLRLEKGDEAASGDTVRWSSEGRQLFGVVDEKDLPPARFNDHNYPGAVLGEMVYGFLPSARVWLSWNEPAPCTILVRIVPREDEAIIDSIVLDRVWQALDKVRPAGVRVLLAVNETIVRGKVL